MRGQGLPNFLKKYEKSWLVPELNTSGEIARYLTHQAGHDRYLLSIDQTGTKPQE